MALAPAVTPRPGLLTLLQALRPLHWSKNLLVFVPFLEGRHGRLDRALEAAGLAFATLCLLASSGYVLNDLLDADQDRRHPRKRRRPIASGALTPHAGLALFATLAAAGFALAAALPAPVARIVTAYWFGSVAYSVALRAVPVVDVLVLAGLFTLRLLAGGVAEDAPLYPHLYWISILLFLSLAMVKRCAELRVGPAEEWRRSRRSYRPGARPVIALGGLALGLASVGVAVHFLLGPVVAGLYRRPALLWLVLPVGAAWIGRLWWLAWSGRVDEDPVAFVLRDRGTLGLGALAAALTIGAL